ncbi:MAG TPA: DNA repair protein RecO, partial [Flavobacterium sp.]|nr:DNA repair protein RecO [Flavobacterium sp.]
KNKGTLEHFKEVKLSFPFQTINRTIFKSTIAIFLSEVLHHAIKEEEKNENLFYYLETTLQWLDTHSHVSNFHLILLLEITKYLGFYPDISNKNLPYFEKIEGIFTPIESSSCLSKEQTRLFTKLIALKLDDESSHFSSTERHTLLNVLLNYYSTHLDGFKKPKSLDVFKEVFA